MPSGALRKASSWREQWFSWVVLVRSKAYVTTLHVYYLYYAIGSARSEEPDRRQPIGGDRPAAAELNVAAEYIGT